MKTRLTSLFLFFFISLSAQTNIQVKSFKLDNGLTIFLNEDPKASKIFGAVAVNAGGKNDPADATGIAHYLEHLLFKGTTEMGTFDYEKEKPHLDSINVLYDHLAKLVLSEAEGTKTEQQKTAVQQRINEQAVAASKYSLPNEFDKLLKGIGSTGVNAWTNNDMTFYHNSFPPNQVLKWLEIYSHRFQKPVFRSFQSELEVVYEEKNRAMDDFQRKVFEKFNKEMFKDHPYGEQTVLGSVEHLKTPSLRKMYEFFDQYYVANNMALILCGNFKSEEVIPFIKEKFGMWRTGKIAEPKAYNPRPFDGKESVKMRITPVKAAILGFQTVPLNHPDRVAIDVVDYMMYNESETGFLNQLEQDNKLIYSGSFPSSYNEAGAGVVFFVPKILVQSFGKAEKLVMGQINKIKTGDFTDQFLAATKSEMYNNFQQGFESLRPRGEAIGEAFNRGISWEAYQNYPQQVNAISKEEVMRVAKKYYGDNYLAMYSRTGFPKKAKLSKPAFKAVQPDQSKSSAFAKSLDNIKEVKVAEKFLDFEKDAVRFQFKNSHEVFITPNPLNDIFSLVIKFEAGYQQIKDLSLTDELLEYSGTANQSLSEVKNAFAALGCSYSFSSGRDRFYVRLSGREENLAKAIKLLNNILTKFTPNEKSLKLLVNEYQTNKRLDKRSPSTMGSIVREYVAYDKNSFYLNRPSIKDAKAFTANKAKDALQKLLTYKSSIHLTTNVATNTFEKILEENLSLKSSEQSSPITYFPIREAKEPVIYFVHDKKAVQSQVHFIVAGEVYNHDSWVEKNAFNTYFGGGFSGLVLQEIREYRSLAYSTYGVYVHPNYADDEKGHLRAYIGCQADKTIEAIKVMNDLISNMPIKKERLSNIKSNLILQSQSNYPSFRNVSQSIDNYEAMGFKNDPNQKAIEGYENLSFDDILQFYGKHLKDKPITIGIYGNKKRINLEALKKLGKVVELRKKDIGRF